MGHEHNHGELRGTKLGISILLNLLITIIQLVGGLFSGSLSLLSDALHNFSDVISLCISYIANKLTSKRYTEKQTFGYKRAEIIAALINASTLLVIAFLLIKEAILRFQNPPTVESIWVISLSFLSILINGGCVLLLKEDSEKNINMHSAYLHLLTDMMTSVAVLLGGVAMYYFHIYWLDSIITILIAIYLVYSTWSLLIKTLKILMQFTPPSISIEAIEKEITSHNDIINLHHVHIWSLNDQEIHFEGHIDFKEDIPLSRVTEILHHLRKILHDKFAIEHTLIQPEFNRDDSKSLIVDNCNDAHHH